MQNGYNINGNGIWPSHVTPKSPSKAPPMHIHGPNQEPIMGPNLDSGNGAPDTGTQFIPIAICGMACRLPGKIHSPQDLWKFLVSKGDARGLVPDTRYNISGYYSSKKKPGVITTEYGYFLDDSIDLGALDTSFFSMARGEVENLDPQQRILLEVSRECLDDAGEVQWKGENVGVYVGSFGNDWYDVTQSETQKYGIYQIRTSHDYALSNRVSYEMDLRGPSMTIRTACSSSLVSLNEACMAIAKGDCASAIVGGTNIIMSPDLTTSMSEQGFLSSDGSCKTFSSAADGYARGEGVVALYIKPLSDAVRDGNPIRAVIVGSASNCDGKTPGFTVPSSTAQEALIRRTYAVAGIDETAVSKTGYFECHGTGTRVGDSAETNAIARVFGRTGGIHIGSLKPNLGHGEGASGLTAVLKAVLALEHRTIPPNIKYLPQNPNIPFSEANLIIPDQPTEWPCGRHERVSVNSFGVGGANAHVIIDSAASFNTPRRDRSKGVELELPQLLVYSANNTQSLKEITARYQEFIDKIPTGINLGDIAYTLANRRVHLPIRSFTVGTKDKLNVASPPSTLTKRHSVVLMFTGQGAQWPQMGRGLIQTNAIFRQTIMSLDNHLQSEIPSAPDWTIEEELLKMPRKSRVNEAEFSQPLCTAIQIALVDTLASVGVIPASVVGHSSGEIAAAYAAGGLTAREAIMVAYYRGLASRMQTKPGAMAAVSLSWEKAEKHLVSGVVIACDNSPSSVTLSGDADRLEVVLAAIKKSHPNVLATTLKVGKAYHSYHMKEVGDQYYHSMVSSRVSGRFPSLPFFSSLTGRLLVKGVTDLDQLGPDYWQKNLESPVLFQAAISSILDNPPQGSNDLVFLEVGPHAALSGPLRQILKHKSSTAVHIPTLLRHQNSDEAFLTTVGKLWTLHIDIDFKALMPRGSCIPDLPRYPWNHQRRYWFESRVSKEWRMREHSHHDLLGVKVPESTQIEPIWRNYIHLSTIPWLRDHMIKKDIIFPFAGYVAMAAEAVRQVSTAQEGVEFRDILVSNALVLREEDPTEVVTTFRRHRLTDSQDSEWWVFTVASYNGHVWLKHCSGQVRASSQTSWGDSKIPEDSLMTQRIAAKQWYNRVRRGGFNYGHHFTTLENMRTSTHGDVGLSMGTAQNNWHGDEANYYLHPVIIDTYLQLLNSAAHHGLNKNYKQLIPAGAESLAFSRCAADTVTLFARCESLGDGAIGTGTCFVDSRTILKASGVTAFPLAENATKHDQQGLPITARPEWVPHIDFQDIHDLIKPVRDHSAYTSVLEHLAQSVVSVARRSLPDINAETEAAHVRKHRMWLSRQASSLDKLDVTALNSHIDKVFASLDKTSVAAATVAIAKIHNNRRSILSGEMDVSDILDADNTLNNLYTFLRDVDVSGFLQCLGHNKPSLRVLEIGVGLDAATTVVQQLKRPDGQVLYSRYVYTDVLPGITIAAKERVKGVPGLEFSTLDIIKDPTTQGFQGKEFDLIIATGGIHTSASIDASLKHVHKLLSPDGRFLIRQPREELQWIKYVLGTLPSWWCGDKDGRVSEPYVSLDRWKERFVSAGFQENFDIVSDSEGMVMVAKPSRQETKPRQVALLCNENETKHAAQLVKELQSRDFRVSYCAINETLAAGQDVISLLDREKPFLDSMDSTSFENLKRFLVKLDSSSGVFWVTKPIQTECPDPRYAPVIGLARTVRSEIATEFATCETDDGDSPEGIRRVVDVFCKFHERDGNAIPGPDFEYAISRGVTRTSRFFPFSLDEELQVPVPSDRAIVKIGQLGKLDSLQWDALPAIDLEGDEVQVAVHATGLNSKDVLEAMGIIKVLNHGFSFGYEAAGVIQRVGPRVNKFNPGDRVIVMTTKALSTTVTTTQLLCEAIPDELSFVDAASMPMAFTTAIHSLVNVAHLQEGQSILIHNGDSGVGLAAIQIARMLEVEIYTTVDSDEKVHYLVENFGIPRTNILDSHDTSFYDGLMRQTRGKGVDVALNSLQGELLHATWRCVAKWGTMVEIGERDQLDSGKLDMDVFLANRTYCCVDLRQMVLERPEVASQLLKTMISYYRRDLIQPIHVAKTFDSATVPEAFKYIQNGTYIGKVVLSLRDDTNSAHLESTTTSCKSTVTLDPSASYLLVGGLGGIGRSISVWMVQHGARSLTFLSRSAGSSQNDSDFARMLESMGCAVQFARGSVANATDVARAVEACPTPLKGIIQLSMVLRDEGFIRMTMDDWKTTTEPKITGTWNLHNITRARGLELDFFLLFSSLSGIVGQPGQANYAAANTFLDAFVLYRASMGLPCTAIDVGPLEGVGYLSEKEGLLKKMQGIGWVSVTEEEVLDAVSASLLTRAAPGQCLPASSSWAVVEKNNMLLGIAPAVPLSSPESSVRLRKDARMAIYHNAGSSNSGSLATTQDDVLGKFLDKANNNSEVLREPKTASMLAFEIGKKLFTLLLKPEQEPDITRGLSELGLDSMVAVELRAWWKLIFRLDISVLDMLAMGTLEALGKRVAKELADLYEG